VLQLDGPPGVGHGHGCVVHVVVDRAPQKMFHARDLFLVLQRARSLQEQGACQRRAELWHRACYWAQSVQHA